MADNITLNAGSGGATLATDDVSGVHHQLAKIEFDDGADGATKVSAANPLPVDLRADNLAGNLDVNIAASAVTVIVDSELPAAAVLSDAFPNPTAPAVGAFLMGFDGTDWERLRVTNLGELRVDVQNASIPVTKSGTWTLDANDGVDIGDVDVASMPATAAEAAALPSEFVVVAADDGTDTHPLQVAANGDLKVTLDSETVTVSVSGAIEAALATHAIMNSGATLTPKFAKIDAAATDNTLVAAVTSKKIRVLALYMIATGDVDARFEDGLSGTALSGQMDLTANSGFVLPFNPVGWFETGAGNLLNLELSAAVSVDGSLVYVEV